MKPEKNLNETAADNNNRPALNGHHKTEASRAATLPGYHGAPERIKRGTRCDCCPYGYHIDLDFVRYCEALYSGAYLEKLKQLRKERRKQSKTMEARLGILSHQGKSKSSVTTSTVIKTETASCLKKLILTSPPPLEVRSMPPPLPPTSEQPSASPRPPAASEPDLLNTSDALRDAVLDFEDTLLNTRSPIVKGDKTTDALSLAPMDLITSSIGTSDIMSRSVPTSTEFFSSTISPFGTFRARSESQSSVSSQSSISSIGFQMNIPLEAAGLGLSPASQQMADTVATLSNAGMTTSMVSSPGVVGIRRNVLTDIRDQMATSLKRMRDLEEQVKTIPVLQVKLSVMKEEKRLLLLQLRAKAGKYDQISLGGGDTSFSDKLSTDEEDTDNRLNQLGSCGIVTPRLIRRSSKDEGRSSSAEDLFVSKTLAAHLGAALAKQGLIAEKEKIANGDTVVKKEFRSVGTSCLRLTRDIGVGHVPEKLKSVGVGVCEEAKVVCSKCKHKISTSDLSSSEPGDSESDMDGRKVKLRPQLPRSCVKCKERDRRVFTSKGVNTESRIDEMKAKLETIMKRKLEGMSVNIREKVSIPPGLSSCAKCEARQREEKRHSLPNLKTVSHVAVNTASSYRKDRGVNSEIRMNDVLSRREIEQNKPKLMSVATDPINWPRNNVSIQAGCAKTRDVACDVKVISTATTGIQAVEKPAPKHQATIGVGIGKITDIVCDKCKGIVKHHMGVGDSRVTDIDCEVCKSPKKSVGTGLIDVRNVFCDRCSNIKTVNAGVGSCSITDTFCDKCELRQMETVGVGDSHISELICTKCKQGHPLPVTHSVGINTTLAQSSPDFTLSRTSSSGSMGLRICDKCNATIESVAKEFVDNNQVSPIPAAPVSRIPRLKVTKTGTGLESASQSVTITQVTATTSSHLTSSKFSPVKTEKQTKISTFATFENLHARLDSSESSPAKPSESKEGVDIKRPVISDKEPSSSDSDNSSSSDSESSISEGTYDSVQGRVIAKCDDDVVFQNRATAQEGYEPMSRQKVELSKEMRSACKVLNDYLVRTEKGSGGKTKNLNSSLSIIQKDWFRVAAQKATDPLLVEDYLDAFEEFSRHLLNRVVNMTDANGNTSMHYAVSNGNFDVVSILLDSKVCDINKQNKAGYTCVMLVSLAEIRNETHRDVVQRLLQLGDVNIKATQNGQTALMLAVSHGRLDMVQALLEAGAAVNLQDNDGSTALMCAAEHGFIEIVKLLLLHPECNASLKDNDGSDALTVSMEAGHRDVGLLIYANVNFSRGSSPYSSLRGRRRNSTPRSTPPPRTTPPLTSPQPSPAASRKSSTSLY